MGDASVLWANGLRFVQGRQQAWEAIMLGKGPTDCDVLIVRKEQTVGPLALDNSCLIAVQALQAWLGKRTGLCP
jgi:hypothetical protein